MNKFFDSRPRNSMGQFAGSDGSGLDPNSMAAAYGGVGQRSQTAMQKIMTALKLRRPVIPDKDPQLSALRPAMIGFDVRPPVKIVRNKPSKKLRRLYGLGGTEQSASAPTQSGNFASQSNDLRFSQFMPFHDGGFVIHKIIGGPIKQGSVSGWFDKHGALVDAEHLVLGHHNTYSRPIKKGGPIWNHVQMHGKRSHEIRSGQSGALSSLEPSMIRFGLLGDAAGFLATRPILRKAAIGAGVGAVAGGGKALVHNAVDPSHPESVTGGALGGAALGGAVGGGIGAAGKMPLAGMPKELGGGGSAMDNITSRFKKFYGGMGQATPAVNMSELRPAMIEFGRGDQFRRILKKVPWMPKDSLRYPQPNVVRHSLAAEATASHLRRAKNHPYGKLLLKKNPTVLGKARVSPDAWDAAYRRFSSLSPSMIQFEETKRNSGKEALGYGALTTANGLFLNHIMKGERNPVFRHMPKVVIGGGLLNAGMGLERMRVERETRLKKLGRK